MNNKQRRKGRRGAKLSFIAGLCTCLMLIAAAACVAFAIFALLDIQPPARDVHAEDFSLDDTETYTTASTHSPSEADSAEPIDSAVTFAETGDSDSSPPLSFEEPLSIVPEYSSLPFFLPENAELYEEFRRERPDLDIESVVWKVNVMLHVPFFSEIQINTAPNPIFVSPAFRLPDDFAPHSLVPVNNEDCYLRATPETVEAFRSLRAASQQAGLNISAASAFRSSTRQSELWENAGRSDGRVARPLHSEHQTGRAIDLWGPGGLLDSDGPSPVGIWVAENAHEHGFIIRYRADTTHITGYIHEPWHITYVGTEISMHMYENNILSLEEFVGRNPEYLNAGI